MRSAIIFCLILSSVLANAQPVNDNALNAIDVTGLVNTVGCSADAAYTTLGATLDKNTGLCWNTAGGTNVWFWFTAPTDQVTVRINTGVPEGTIRYPYVALWDTDTLSQLACERYTSQYSDLEMSYVGLTPGNRYFISVDNNSGSAAYRGTFKICMDSSASNDFVEGAIFVDSLMNTCSPDASYDTRFATNDAPDGSCWNTTGGSDRWFAFVATTSQAKIELKTGAPEGSLRYPYIALWNSDQSSQIGCQTYTGQYSDLTMNVVGLIPGDTFYIQVDNHNGSINYRGTFALCLSDSTDHDFVQNAIFVDSLMNTCSPNASYTTVQKTKDETPGSCWNTLGGSNVWFAFVATTTQAKIELKTGAPEGSLRYPYIALWSSDLSTQVGCQRYTSQYSDLTMNVVGLTPGDTFYIEVDNHNGSANYRGTFMLCFSDITDHDFVANAIFVDSLMNTCSPNASYSTVQKTKDENPGSCWNTAGGSNVWFAFVATTTQVKIEVKTEAPEGSIRYPYVALWNSDLSTEVGCQRYTSQYSDLTMNVVGLTPGDTFYIEVDNHNGSINYRGTFMLCLTDVTDYDFVENAKFVDTLMNTCSPNAAYTTVQATKDQSPGSCWNTTGGSNRWFYFIATTTQAKIEVKTGAPEGSLRYPYVALWNSDLSTEVACQRYTSQYSDLTMNVINLIPGDTFYIEVDNHNGSTNYRGTFMLCLSDSVDYDFQEGAKTLFDVTNWCSANAVYTTVQATPDKNSGLCWNTTGGSNRWFKFVATTAEVNVKVNTGAPEGTIRYPYVALWDTDGLTQLACERYTSQYSDLDMDYTSLVPGNTYYISVDNHNGSLSYRGTFQLCVTDKVTYDFYERALVLTDLNGWCSGNAVFNTQLATPDKNPASCWNTTGGSNRWFTFQAISPNVIINLNTGAPEGTLRYPYLALWDSTGLVEIDCQTYSSQYSDLTINYMGLTVGKDYYITVDNHNGSTSYRGTFELCITNVADTLYSISSGNWATATNWSAVSHVGPPTGAPPSFGDVVNIEHGINTSADVEVAEVNLNIASGQNGRLTVTGGSILEVRGKFRFTNTGNNRSGQLQVLNGAMLNVLDTLYLQRDGGDRAFSISLDNTSSMNLNKSLMMDINGGTVQINRITLSNSSRINVTEDFVMDYSGGTKILVVLNDTAQFTVTDSIQFIATGDNQIEIELNDSSQLFIGGNFSTGTPRYGILDCNDFSTLNFLSTQNLQIFPANTAVGTTDDFTYQNIVINNSRVSRPQVDMTGAISIPKNIQFIDGVIGATMANLLTLPNGATVTGQNDASYVEGPVQRFGSSDFMFPVGKDGVYAPLEVTNLFASDAATEFTAEYFFTPYSDVLSIGPGLNNVSWLEYWELTQAGNLDSTTLTLHWRSSSRSDIDDFNELKIVHYNGSQWDNLGQISNVPGPQGSITVNGVNSFSPFTFGSGSAIVNFLPVEFIYVDAIANDQDVEIIWGTAIEINNRFFEIQRSYDLQTFQTIGQVDGKGDQTGENHYSYLDSEPVNGTLYYRIKQVDEDGKFSFSKFVAVEYSNGYDLKIYPNPVNGSLLNLILPNSKTNLKVEIYDINGQLFNNLSYSKNGNEYQIDVRSLPKGLYVLTMNDGPRPYHRKFIIN
jgi:hypothetical protein